MDHPQMWTGSDLLQIVPHQGATIAETIFVFGVAFAAVAIWLSNRKVPSAMLGRVYVPVMSGLLLAAIGARNLLSDGLGWWAGFCLTTGVAALALAFYYWRGLRAQGS